MNYFQKDIFRSSRLQMFFKIDALKIFAILRMKKRLQHRCFPVRCSHMINILIDILLTSLSQLNHPSRTPSSQNIYHQLLLSCECSKVFKESFYVEYVWKELFAYVLQNRCSKQFCKLHRKALLLESLFKKLAD